MANNAVMQRGFSLPEKTYKEQNLTIPEFDWISIFPASIEPDSYLLFSLGKFGFTQP